MRWAPRACMAGTVCDTCCETAWEMTVGPVGGADPEDVVHSDLVISWGADLAATNVHFWALAEEQRKKRGVPIVVIDPRRTRSAKAADLYLPIRIGTDAALALGIMHILVRDKLADRDYIAKHTLGFDKVEREILPKFEPAARRRDHRPCRRRHREARGDVRQGQGRDDPAGRRHDATDAWRPGAAHRGAAAGRVGPLCRAGRRRAAADRGVVRPQLRRHPQALGAGRDAQRQSPAPGRRALEHEGPADPRALRVGQQPGGDLPRGPQGAEGPFARGPVHRGARSLHDRHGEVRRHRAAGGELPRDRRSLSRLRRLLDAVGPAGRQAAGRGAVELRRGPGARQAHGPQRRDLQPRSRRTRPRSCSRARPALPPPPIRPSCSPASRSTSSIPSTASRSRRRRASSSSIPSSSPSRASRRCPTGTRIRSKWPKPPSGRCAC